MGRGRAKAKQTKVARDLKYNSGPSTDLSRLQQELGGSSSGHQNTPEDDEGYEDDRWASSDR